MLHRNRPHLNIISAAFQRHDDGEFALPEAVLGIIAGGKSGPWKALTACLMNYHAAGSVRKNHAASRRSRTSHQKLLVKIIFYQLSSMIHRKNVRCAMQQIIVPELDSQGKDKMCLKYSIATALLLASVTAASAQTINVPAGTYVADKTHTNVLWSVKHFGLSNYIGRFDNIDAKLELDPAAPAKSKLTVTIDPKSVDTNDAAVGKDFNAEIYGEKFFDAAKFDKITFVSTEVTTTGNDTGTIKGDLTFHGVTKPVTLNVKMNGALNPHPMTKKAALGFSATGTIKRSEFGVNYLVGPVVSDDVNLTIETEFVAQ